MAPIYLALAIIFNSAANSLFKVASAIPDLTLRKATLFGVALFIGLINTICFIKTLEKLDLGVSYTIFSAGSIIVISLSSLMFFHESFSAQKIIGMVVICAGIILMWRA